MEMSASLIDKILVSFEGLLQKKNLSNNQDTDDEENFNQPTQNQQKSDPISQTILINSMSNLKKAKLSNYFYVGRILLALIGISSDGNKPRKSVQSEEIDILFPEFKQSSKSLADRINSFYDQNLK